MIVEYGVSEIGNFVGLGEGNLSITIDIVVSDANLTQLVILELYEAQFLAEGVLCSQDLFKGAIHIVVNGLFESVVNMFLLGRLKEVLERLDGLEIDGLLLVVDHEAPLAVDRACSISHVAVGSVGR